MVPIFSALLRAQIRARTWCCNVVAMLLEVVRFDFVLPRNCDPCK